MRRSPENRHPSYVFVELKQWSHAHADPDDTRPGLRRCHGSRPLLHPAEQVTRYVDYTRLHPGVGGPAPESVVGAAYLHNANDDGVLRYDFARRPERGRMFTATERGEWLNFLASRLAPEPVVIPPTYLLKFKIAPEPTVDGIGRRRNQTRSSSSHLMSSRSRSVVMNAVRQMSEANTKTVVIVTGGPGAARTDCACRSSGSCTGTGRAAIHATGSSTAGTMRKVAGHRDKRVQELFKYFQLIRRPPKRTSSRVFDRRRGPPHSREQQQPLRRRLIVPTSRRSTRLI